MQNAGSGISNATIVMDCFLSSIILYNGKNSAHGQVTCN